MAYTKYSLTPADNNAAPPNGAPEGMLPSAVNDTMRDMMAQIRDVGDGIRGGTYTMTAPVITGGSITGSTINNSAIGGTTAAAGKFTTLEATGVTTLQAGTVSAPAITTTGDTNTGIFFPAADTIAFTEGGTEAMRIDSSGNVGIGTSSPSVRLDLGSGANVSGFKMTDQWQDIVTGSHIVGTRYNYGSGTYYGRLYSNATGFNLDTGTSAVNMVFGTNNTERMRIDSSGNLLVGTTSVLGKISLLWNSSTQQGLVLRTTSSTFNGYPVIFYNNADVASGLITQAQNSVTYGTSSDYRLKENIAPMSGALAKISQLKPVTYTWKSDNSNSQGFIAHEIQAIVPECVSGEKDAVNEDGSISPQTIDTSFLVATLTAAIQEQQAMLTELKATVDAQAARLTALENK
jgi:hypothetical protein